MGTLTDTRFLFGFIVGLAACWAFHHYAAPMPGPNKAAKRQAGG